MDGIVNLSKPLHMTSARAVERVRRTLAPDPAGRVWPRGGHAGSLDPLASGVLVVCLGYATKLVERVMDQPKIYRASIRLDIKTASFDLELPVETVTGAVAPSTVRVREVLDGLEGEILQVPPATSAVKIRGRPAYKLARGGRKLELEPRPVRVYWIALRRYAWPELDIDVACGRGTYIRALVRDIGIQLSTGGCLSALQRLAVGPFRIEDSWTLERLDADSSRATAVIPVETARGLLAEPTVPERPTAG